MSTNIHTHTHDRIQIAFLYINPIAFDWRKILIFISIFFFILFSSLFAVHFIAHWLDTIFMNRLFAIRLETDNKCMSNNKNNNKNNNEQIKGISNTKKDVEKILELHMILNTQIQWIHQSHKGGDERQKAHSANLSVERSASKYFSDNKMSKSWCVFFSLSNGQQVVNGFLHVANHNRWVYRSIL